MRITHKNIAGLNVTIMGLGLHGGGLASARFFAERGARVTVTDLRDEEALRPTMEKLEEYRIRYVLERHEIDDFKNADLVIKNPAVRLDSPFLQAASQVETDISVFLQFHRGPVYAVTGTKGKSTTSSAIHHIIECTETRALLGGNITVSPLEFLSGDTGLPIVLELSSWQLADLRGKGILRPDIAVITNILNDHQDRYASMKDYVSDKMVLFEDQQPGQTAIFNFDDPLLRNLTGSDGVTSMYFSSRELPADLSGAYLDGDRGIYRNNKDHTTILDSTLLKGNHNRLNLLCAALACACGGMSVEAVRRGAATFAGIEHRLEFVRRLGGIEFYNDSAATIPDATAAAVESFERKVILIAGGTDKELDFAIFSTLGNHTKAIYLLEGNATLKIMSILDEYQMAYHGPFSSLGVLVEGIMAHAAPGDIVVFSPGCTSFGMFRNEFDRGLKFKALVQELQS